MSGMFIDYNRVSMTMLQNNRVNGQRRKGVFMIKLEKTSVMNLENAMRGARNPMNSWHAWTAITTKITGIYLDQ